MDQTVPRIKTFYGTFPNAVRIQIWIASSVYLLVAIARRRPRIERDLYPILQIDPECLCARESASRQVLAGPGYTPQNAIGRNQLSFCDL